MQIGCGRKLKTIRIAALADKGWRKALLEDPHLRNGLNIYNDQVTCQPVAEAHELSYATPESILA